MAVALALLGSALDGGAEPGFLVLRNGEVLHGDVAKLGDRYLVVLGDGAELRIPVRDVEMHCRDLDEAYLRKRSVIPPRDIDGRLRLTAWCLRNSLFAQAADELLAVASRDPGNPHLPILERRLANAVREPSPRLAAPVERPQHVSLDELERTTRKVPDGALEAFSARIQPLLMNRCAASCCHGGRSDAEMQFSRSASGKALTRRFTHQNLYAVLQQIELEEGFEVLQLAGGAISLPVSQFID
jgi:hypothetical protein